MVLVTFCGAAPIAVKYEQMGVLGSSFCWRRWRKLQATAETRFPCPRSVAYMVVDSPLTLFLCASRKRVTSLSCRKTLVESSYRMTP